MSQETMEWLNSRTLIGFTDKRGEAWHFRSDLQGDESNHYKGAIPVKDVLRRLFDFDVIDTPIYVPSGDSFKEVEGRKAMVCSDNGDVLGIFKSGYQGHAYKGWLLDNVSMILDDTLGIGSAGLLKGRGQAWVSVEVPDNITTKEGVEFRPSLLACTSFDGSLATTYKRVFGIVVCDNTLSAALGEKDQTYKIKHSKYSDMKLQNARDALAIVHTMSDEFTKEVTRLTSWKVSEKQFLELLDVNVPLPKEEDAPKRGVTVAEKKRAEIINLYHDDERVTPWKGTAYGVLAAYNTWLTHKSQVRKGAPRIIRVMEAVVSDRMAAHDTEILDRLAVVTGKK